jgi:hypothetical protein
MPVYPADRIRSVLAIAGPGGASQGLELALAAALDAGRKAIADNPRLMPAEQVAVALQAAAEALDDIGLALAEGEGQAED